MSDNPFELPGGGPTKPKTGKPFGEPRRLPGVEKHRAATAPPKYTNYNPDTLAGLFSKVGLQENAVAVGPQLRNQPSRAAHTQNVKRFVPQIQRKTTHDARVLNMAAEAIKYMMRYEDSQEKAQKKAQEKANTDSPENTMEFNDARGVEYLRALFAADEILRRKQAVIEKQLAKMKTDIEDNRLFYGKYMGEISANMIPPEMPKKLTSSVAMMVEGGKKRRTQSKK